MPMENNEADINQKASGPAPSGQDTDNPAEDATPPPVEPNDRRVAELDAAKKTIDRLLAYAVANPDIPIDDTLLAQAVKVLRKPSQEFTEADEIALWDSQSDLAKRVKPASDLSLKIAQQLNGTHWVNVPDNAPETTLWQWLLQWLQFWKRPAESPAARHCRREMIKLVGLLLASVIVYVVIQGHCALSSAALTSSGKVLDEWKNQQPIIANVRANLLNGQDNSPQILELRGKLNLLAHQISASSQALSDLIRPMVKINTVFFGRAIFISHSTSAILENCETGNLKVQQVFSQMDMIPALERVLGDSLPQVAQPEGGGAKPAVTAVAGNSPGPGNLLACMAFEREYALALYTVLSRYILPLVLGMVGAMAYMARHALYRLDTNSYLPAATGRLWIRLCLGGLLGAISGIFLSADLKEAQGFNISLTMVALIMGYSVEVAFSLFDSVIQRMKDWTDSLRTLPSDTPKKPQGTANSGDE